MPETHAARRRRAQELIRETGADAALITARPNVRYLTGYTGSNGVAVIGGNLCAFITDFRYVEQAADEVDPGFDRRQAQQDLLEDVPSVLPDEPLRLAGLPREMTLDAVDDDGVVDA